MFNWTKRVVAHLRNFVVAEDQALNQLTPGGVPDETISSHSQRSADRGNWVGRGMTKFLHLFQRDHGRRAQEGDVRRAQDVEKLEQSDKP